MHSWSILKNNNNRIILFTIFNMLLEFIATTPNIPLPAHPATINRQNMTANIRTRFTSKVHRRPLEILRRTPSSRRNTRANASQTLRVIQQRSIHLRLNVPRRNSVDSNTLGRPLIGKALGHLADCALGSSVRGHREATLETEQRAKVDDATAAAGDGRRFEGEHVGAYVAAEGEDGVEVDLHDLFSICQ